MKQIEHVTPEELIYQFSEAKRSKKKIIRYLKLVECTPTVNILYIGLTVNLVRYKYLIH